jgi:hypothetical protein
MRGKGQGNPAADARAAAGDERNFVLQQIVLKHS